MVTCWVTATPHVLLLANNGSECHFILGDFVSTFEVKGKKVLSVQPEALTLLSENAFTDIAHLLRPAHLQVKRCWFNNEIIGSALFYFIICLLLH